MERGERNRGDGELERVQSPGAAQLRASMTAVELAQDIVTLLVGVALVVLAVAILVSAVADFFQSRHSLLLRASSFLDEVLLVLILVEIVHTVMLSLRSHELAAEPFIVVALIAAIRKLLFVLGSQQQLTTAEYALLLSTAGVFVFALVALRRWAPSGVGNRPG